MFDTLWAQLHALVDFVRDNPQFGAPTFFLLAVAENLAFISLLVPATGIMVALAPIIAKSGVDPVPLVAASWGGAWLGFATTYWLGLYTTGERLQRWHDHSWVMYILRGIVPQMVRHSRIATSWSEWVVRIAVAGQTRAEEFFVRWGVYSILLGHFFGPVRGFISFVAGTSKMPQTRFHLANTVASFLWAVGMLSLPLVVHYRERLPGWTHPVLEWFA